MATNRDVVENLQFVIQKIEGLTDPDDEWDPEIMSDECDILQDIIDDNLDN